ncbi:hypothetical protein A3C32_00055 [Candidatus Daviesbacteria bacterium RIFCSPHIGHO2_02_FULL_41_14]|uniref:DUF2905 domain-containing protein n=1 Tax=Candidatus Daviesbacteria bacterium RIFCSPLOWO2_01_FULL_40_24 TaxID=1797787 RepID=A0A1F5MIW7_9BACT|nr:MAG: hypothetical protein A2780_00715 [Candidatus Daviesbacteria bacterium RIFCSPHIGHO2_01_FULL_41_45]OGE34075.1 MAG: hypothetical protein A3C32_00055 [Candidatus Daviesbacteria bacterium RIFCSPHIGHO2_02_FULL_41_14]OGE65230.1 MAG: hypothetical protein A3B49_02250 [Candidatus Daviesbacteria bacterium RIFCSPLOWO2_01_FULL_40_24]
MPDIIKIVYLLVGVFLVLGLLANIGGRFPKLPGDIDIDKPGIKLYIPFTSAIIISVILTLLFNFFRK